MAASQELTAQGHTIIRTTIGQYYVNQAVTRGVPRDGPLAVYKEETEETLKTKA